MIFIGDHRQQTELFNHI